MPSRLCWSPCPEPGRGAGGCDPAGTALSVFSLCTQPSPVAPGTGIVSAHAQSKSRDSVNKLPVAFQGKQLGGIALRYFLCQSRWRDLDRKTQFAPGEAPRGFGFLYKGTLMF